MREPESLELNLQLETPALKAGEQATFIVTGPEKSLQSVIAEFSLSDELGRRLSQGRIPLGLIQTEEGQPRRVKDVLCQSATDLGREKTFQGHGMLDVLREQFVARPRLIRFVTTGKIQ